MRVIMSLVLVILINAGRDEQSKDCLKKRRCQNVKVEQTESLRSKEFSYE